MGREPHVMRITLNKQAVFSDVLHRTLTNGWYFELPNEVYFTDDGKALDATGVPPDIQVPFVTPGDLVASRNGALDEAIRQSSGAKFRRKRLGSNGQFGGNCR